ncbi:MAG TPA: hypothetical protein VJJ22_02405 [Candidatus Paceibacterota bacterium]
MGKSHNPWLRAERKREAAAREYRYECYQRQLKLAREACSALVNGRNYNSSDLLHEHDSEYCSKAQCYGIAEALGSGPDDARRFYERWADDNPE